MDLELKRNFVFCGGIGNPEFYPADFDNKSEETVLFTRVSLGLKPIASIVMQPSWNTEDRIKMVRTARRTPGAYRRGVLKVNGYTPRWASAHRYHDV